MDDDGRSTKAATNRPGPGQTTRGQRVLRYGLTILGILAVLGVLGAIKGAQIGKLIGFGKKYQEDGPPPEAIGASPSRTETWEETLSAVGSVASTKGVTLSNDLAGTVTKIHFESGATVKEGEVLVELDTSVERTQLAAAKARLDLATVNAARTRALVASGALSASQRDTDEAAYRTAGTDFESIEAQIAKKVIRAPFAGKVGFRSINLGQYLNPGTAVATIETYQAVHVDFTLPQQRLPDLKTGLTVRISIGGDAGALLEGKIGAVDPNVDPATRTVRVRADINDKDAGLLPGMFVTVEVVLPKRADVVVVPATAIVHAPYGDSVFFVENKAADSPGIRTTQSGQTVKTARQQFVRVGQSRGDFVAVVEGVKPGETVVTAGGFKLRNNAPIYVDNTKNTKPELDPHPENR